jgi:hypothetical protein
MDNEPEGKQRQGQEQTGSAEERAALAEFAALCRGFMNWMLERLPQPTGLEPGKWVRWARMRVVPSQPDKVEIEIQGEVIKEPGDKPGKD